MRTLYNAGDQSIRFTPIDPRTGRVAEVTGASYRIVDLRHPDTSAEHVIVDDTAATVDDGIATLTASAGYAQASAVSLSLAHSGLATGRPYLLSSATGSICEVVTLASIGLQDAITATPLRYNYSTGDSLSGIQLIGTFPAAEANDEDNVERSGGPYLVTWSYTYQGQALYVPTTLYLDRYSVIPPIDATYVLQASPDLAQRARSYVDSAISVAWEDFLSRAECTGHDPQSLPPGLTVRVAVRTMALAHLHRWVGGSDSDLSHADALEDRARGMFNDVLVSSAPRGQIEIKRNNVEAVKPHGAMFKLS
jgi:hypothetical protein